MITKTQIQYSQNSFTNKLLTKKQKVVISLFGNHAHGKTTAAILIAVGLAELGKAVHFVNLDETARIPLVVPYIPKPDILVMNCPNTADVSVVECTKVANMCIIVSSPAPRSINGSKAILKQISKHVSSKGIWVLPTAIASQHQKMKIIKSLSDFSSIPLKQLPAIPLHSAISNCTSNGYLEQDAVIARKQILPICKFLVEVFDGQ